MELFVSIDLSFVILCVLRVLNVDLGCSAGHFDFKCELKCEHQSCDHFEYLDIIIIIPCSSLLKPSKQVFFRSSSMKARYWHG